MSAYILDNLAVQTWYVDSSKISAAMLIGSLEDSRRRTHVKIITLHPYPGLWMMAAEKRIQEYARPGI